MEQILGRKFGDTEAMPLLVAVRSGARESMPGMMDTILNLGLNEKSVEAMVKATGNPRFAWDCYRRFVQMYGDVVLGMSGRPVTIRTLDLGADKADKTGLALRDEPNPALGLRGVRLSLAREGPLRTPLRAMARATCTPKRRTMTCCWSMGLTRTASPPRCVRLSFTTTAWLRCPRAACWW